VCLVHFSSFNPVHLVS